MFLIILFISLIQANARTIELTNDNFVSLRGSITSQSINNIINDLIKLKVDTRYIYLNTNGGSVDAGLKLVNTIKDLTNKNIVVNCIADTAISMGFVIFQSCKGRYVLEHSTLMQHQISLSHIEGQIRNINSYFKFINNMENKLNKIQANRIGLSLESFEEKIHDDWWLDSEDSIKNNVSDEIVNIYCNFENSEEEVTINELFGQIKLVYSKCPQVSSYIRIQNDDNMNKIFESNRFIDRLIY
jgi:ATP-dependent Clp endopeptidase proteolytic subunit ClpP